MNTDIPQTVVLVPVFPLNKLVETVIVVAGIHLNEAKERRVCNCTHKEKTEHQVCSKFVCSRKVKVRLLQGIRKCTYRSDCCLRFEISFTALKLALSHILKLGLKFFFVMFHGSSKA